MTFANKPGIIAFIKSFVSGGIVEQIHSPKNGDLFVLYINGKYMLNTVDTNYSYGELHRGFQKIFKKINIKKTNPKTVLLLGLGCGSVPAILCEELEIDCKITAVEFDPVVLSLGNKYFNLKRFNQLEIVVKDAFDFVKNCQETYDLVVFDIYINNKIPTKFEEQSFLFPLSKLLNRHGVMVFNKDINNDYMRQSMPMLEINLNANFPGIQKLQVVENNYFFVTHG